MLKRWICNLSKNSRKEAKAKTKFVGKKTDLPGITEELAELNMLLERKLRPDKEEPDGNEQHSL